jgi:5-methylcytosine-specific restriction endonuclease McrA
VDGMLLSPDSCPALVLNADYQPLSYYPLSLWHWQTVVKAVCLKRVNIVSEYDRSVRSINFELRLPSVIALKKYVKPATYPAFTRFNLFLRDRFICQYCGAGFHRHNGHELTFDHVKPRSHGGRTTWENVTTACSPCNLRKGGRTPREASMPPMVWPYRPTVHQLQANGRSFPPNYLHDSWRDYLYWDSVLEP